MNSRGCQLFFYIASLVFTAIASFAENGSSRLPQQERNSQFIRRFFHGSFIIGNTLYIDGGEVTHATDGIIQHSILNFTLAIDLSTSFSTSLMNNGVQIQNINKGRYPNLNFIRFWTDVAANTVYAYGGEISPFIPWVGSTTTPLESLWSFTPGAAGGTWKSLDQSSPVFDSITRPCQGSVASGNIGGFNLGGYASPWTSQKIDGSGQWQIPVPGLQFYNFTSQEWSNNSATAYTPYGTAIYSGTAYVPTWGSAGLLVAFGGRTSPSLSSFVEHTAYLAMSNISIFDPSTQSWYHQKATGDVPTQREMFCVVGIGSDIKSTYEVFLYGGEVGNGDWKGSSAALKGIAGMDEVYILSLPSFVWFKANYTSSDPRAQHTCNIVGNRQMLSIGGYNPSNTSFSAAINDTDPFWEGIKIFDLTALRWTNYYNASAAPYTAPTAVAAHYAAGSRYPSAWSSDGLKNLFVKPETKATTPVKPSAADSPKPGERSTTNSGAAMTADSPQHGERSTTDSGAAVIGGVVGGIAGLLIVGLLLYFLALKRVEWINRKPEVSRPPTTDTDHMPGSMVVRRGLHEADARQALPHEVDSGQNLPHEAGSGNLYELSGRMVVGRR